MENIILMRDKSHISYLRYCFMSKSPYFPNKANKSIIHKRDNSFLSYLKEFCFMSKTLILMD